MTTQTFKNKLKKYIESNDEFVTDTLGPQYMRELRQFAKSRGYDDMILVAGEDENETFILHIQKIEP